MARPQILQRLKHGKLLCRKVFASFVETWNYIVNRIENLKGDADANPQTGHIKIDNTDPEHPIMRLVNIQDFGNGEGTEVVGDSDLTNASTYSVHVGKRTEQEGGETYATLYNFDQTPSESATATLDSNQGQYDVGSGDWFLVKNGNELKYKKITIETDLPGGGGGSSGNCGAFAYDETTHTIKNGMYLRARRYSFVSDATVSSSGYAYLQIDMGTSGTATVVTGASSIPSTTNQMTYIPLYYFDANLKPTADYRGAPTLQIWEYS